MANHEINSKGGGSSEQLDYKAERRAQLEEEINRLKEEEAARQQELDDLNRDSGGGRERDAKHEELEDEIGKEALEQTLETELTPEQKLAFAYRDRLAMETAYQHDISRELIESNKFGKDSARQTYAVEKNEDGSVSYTNPETGRRKTIKSGDAAGLDALNKEIENFAHHEANNNHEASIAAKEIVDKTSVGLDMAAAERLFREEVLDVAKQDPEYIEAEAQIARLKKQILQLRNGLNDKKLSPEERAEKAKVIKERFAEIKDLDKRKKEIANFVELNAEDVFKAHEAELKEIDERTGNVANPDGSNTDQAGDWRGVGSYRNFEVKGAQDKSDENKDQTDGDDKENGNDGSKDKSRFTFVVPESEPEPEQPSPEPEPEQPKRQKVEVPPINPGNYPELYARTKGLFNNEENSQLLEEEGERLRKEIADNIEAEINNYLVEHPEATPEQIRAEAQELFVDAQNKLAEKIKDAIDGKGYEDSSGNIVHKNVLRRFGAWMDKHGKTLKKVMLGVGIAGAVVLTAGIATGAIVPAFALGAGTITGAAKGAAMGGIFSRHGSKETAADKVGKVDMSNEEFAEFFAQMDAGDQNSFRNISNYLIEQYNTAADKDHNLNVRKTRKSMILGGVIGGLAGSLSFNSPQEITRTNTELVPREFQHQVEVPNHGPTLDQNMQIGNWGAGDGYHQSWNTADVFSRVSGQPYELFEGSMQNEFISQLAEQARAAGVDLGSWSPGETLVHAGNLADAANEPLRNLLNFYLESGDWGSHMETVTETIFQPEFVTETTHQLVGNLPATIVGWLSGLGVAGFAARQAEESTHPRRERQPAGRPGTQGAGGETPPPAGGGESAGDGGGGESPNPNQEPNAGQNSAESGGTDEQEQPQAAEEETPPPDSNESEQSAEREVSEEELDDAVSQIEQELTTRYNNGIQIGRDRINALTRQWELSGQGGWPIRREAARMNADGTTSEPILLEDIAKDRLRDVMRRSPANTSTNQLIERLFSAERE